MRLVQWLSVVLVAVSSAACAPIWTDDGMYLVRGRAGALFLKPPPLDLSRYRGVIIGEIQIGTKQRSRELKPFEEERLRGYFARRLGLVFERYGWTVVETPGQDVLLARLSVRELDLREPDRSHFGSVVSEPSSNKIKLALELLDSVNHDRRLLFGDKRRLPFGVYAGSEPVAIRRVEDAFYHFSIDVKRRLDGVRHGEFPPPPRAS